MTDTDDDGRLVALLRGINLGGHRVKMDRLREAFGEAGLENVETVIASGNVVFDATGDDPCELEARLERHLETALGFPAPAFVRTHADLAAIADADEVAAAEADGFDVHVVFLREAADAHARAALDDLEGEDDRFRTVGREVWWLRRGRLTDSPVSNAALTRAIGKDTTQRNLKTLRRIVGRARAGG